MKDGSRSKLVGRASGRSESVSSTKSLFSGAMDLFRAAVGQTPEVFAPPRLVKVQIFPIRCAVCGVAVVDGDLVVEYGYSHTHEACWANQPAENQLGGGK